jgi:Tol biopolymer transport system component
MTAVTGVARPENPEYPAGGRHYVFVTIVDGNWEVYLGDLTGEPPKRLTWSPGFDGLPSLSRNGKK